MRLDDAPSIQARASTTKNGKIASIPLHPKAEEALRGLHNDAVQPLDYVFRGRLPEMDVMRRDLNAAGIPYRDEEGRVFDFHALRMTFGTWWTLSGATPRETMEAMRHSDIKLTMGIYTDAGKLALREAMNKLPNWMEVTHK